MPEKFKGLREFFSRRSRNRGQNKHVLSPGTHPENTSLLDSMTFCLEAAGGTFDPIGARRYAEKHQDDLSPDDSNSVSEQPAQAGSGSSQDNIKQGLEELGKKGDGIIYQRDFISLLEESVEKQKPSQPSS